MAGEMDCKNYFVKQRNNILPYNINHGSFEKDWSNQIPMKAFLE